MNNKLGITLRERRKAKKLTLKQVSDMSRIHTSHLGRIERGERFPSGRILKKLAKPLDFSEVELFQLAGFLSQDGKLDRFKEEIKLEVTRALMRILEKVDSL